MSFMPTHLSQKKTRQWLALNQPDTVDAIVNRKAPLDTRGFFICIVDVHLARVATALNAETIGSAAFLLLMLNHTANLIYS